MQRISTLTLIDPATEQDLLAIVEIDRACFPTPWTRAEYEAELTRITAVLRVLRTSESGTPVGFILSWLADDTIELLKVATAPAFRRQGLANALIKDLVRTAKQDSLRQIFLELRKSNNAARKLYEAHRFKIVGERPNYYENNEDAWLMTRNLRADETYLTNP